MSELSQENERLHVTSYKLFFQELQSMSVVPRIFTDPEEYGI